MLATTGSLPVDDSGWAFEIKWDGVRAITYWARGGFRTESRNGNDITTRYPELAGLVDALGGRGAVLDGEVVCFDQHGRPNFGQLQHRMHLANAAEIQRRMAELPVVYMIFDVLWLDGKSLLSRPYRGRRDALEGLGLLDVSWQTPSSHIGDGKAMFEASRANGLEGLVAKRLDAAYEPGRRSRCWLKMKNIARQEMVIGGWLPGAGNRSGRIGALLIGYQDGGLRFAGKVGTGFTDRTLSDLAERLAPLSRLTSPFVDPVPHGDARFVEARLVCDVEFTEWTAGATLRHPSFKGLREDKTPEEVVREPTP